MTSPTARAGVRVVLAIGALALVVAAIVAVARDRPEASTTPSAPDPVARDGSRSALELEAGDASVAPDDVAFERPAADAKRRSADARGTIPVSVRLKNRIAVDAPPELALGSLLVEVAVARSGEEVTAPALASARTAADGTVRIDVRGSDLDELRRLPGALDLVARVHERGWQSNYASLGWLLPEVPIELEIEVARGGTILGRVLDADGEPLGAHVDVRPAGAADARRGAFVQGAGRNGIFLVLLEREGPYDVYAQEPSAGTGILRGHPVRFTDPPQQFEITLVGPGRLRGRVRDARGEAVANVSLALVLGGVERTPAEIETLRREGQGNLDVFTRTDGEGRFDVRGLRDGRYAIEALVRDRPARALTSAPVVADGLELELVFDRPHVVVRVRDADGAPWKHASWDLRQPGTPEVRSDGWPEDPRVRIVPAARRIEDQLAEQRVPERVVESRIDGDAWTFEIAAGAYDAVLEGGDVAFESRRFEAREESGRVEVELVARRLETGRISVRMVDAEGEPVAVSVGLRLEDRATGMVAYSRTYLSFFGAQPQELDVPPGTWRLVAEGQPASHRTPTPGGRGETVLTVRPGATTEASVVLERGAYLRVALTIDGVTGAEAGDAHEVEPAPVTDDVRPSRPCATLWLLEDMRAPLRIWFPGVSSPTPYDLDRSVCLQPVSAAKSGELPAGAFTLEARLRDGRILRKPVVLVAGKTTEVAVEF